MAHRRVKGCLLALVLAALGSCRDPDPRDAESVVPTSGTPDSGAASDDVTERPTDGGASVACAPGFTGDGGACTDVDECAANNGGCDVLTTCTNTPGSRTCGACPAGYDGTGLTGCTDVDECAANNGGCDANATCSNTTGSRTCACKKGYAGSGLTCTALQTFSVVATSKQEVQSPLVVSSAKAIGTCALALDRTSLECSIVYTSNLQGAYSAAHLHGDAVGSSKGLPGHLAPVLVGFSMANGGPSFAETLPLTAAQADELEAGRLYLNVHSNSAPSGEIRGQLVRTGATLYTAASSAGPSETTVSGCVLDKAKTTLRCSGTSVAFHATSAVVERSDTAATMLTMTTVDSGSNSKFEGVYVFASAAEADAFVTTPWTVRVFRDAVTSSADALAKQE